MLDKSLARARPPPTQPAISHALDRLSLPRRSDGPSKDALSRRRGSLGSLAQTRGEAAQVQAGARGALGAGFFLRNGGDASTETLDEGKHASPETSALPSRRSRGIPRFGLPQNTCKHTETPVGLAGEATRRVFSSSAGAMDESDSARGAHLESWSSQP